MQASRYLLAALHGCQAKIAEGGRFSRDVVVKSVDDSGPTTRPNFSHL